MKDNIQWKDKDSELEFLRKENALMRVALRKAKFMASCVRSHLFSIRSLEDMIEEFYEAEKPVSVPLESIIGCASDDDLVRNSAELAGEIAYRKQVRNAEVKE